MSAIRQCRLAAAALALAFVAACAPVVPVAPEAASCRSFLDDLDARVDAAGQRDGGAHRVAGHPWLRSDRLLASFAVEATDGAPFEAWVERLAARDLAARRAELANLDAADAPATLARVQACAEQLTRVELADAGARARLREAVRVPDDYSRLARALGAYPLAVPLLNLGIAGYHEEVRADYARPLEQLDAGGPLVLWTVDASADAARAARLVQRAPRDALGLPQLDAADWAQLAAAHAPAFWIEQGGDYDRPGAMTLDARGTPGLDVGRPQVYWQGEMTRFGDAVLPTLVYTVWFAERPRSGRFDPYGGRLDGLVWRVALDARGQVLAYDTIHPCGCYRYHFPAQALRTRERGGYWQEPVLLPQAEVPPAPLALRVQSATHFVRRLVPRAQANGARAQYRLAPYEELLSLPQGEGRRRSLFGADGIVRGTERGERWWLWPSGVPSPGAMRQWGRHATSFVGSSHFDDARYLEQTFVPPERRPRP